jgi:hypothetical protein
MCIKNALTVLVLLFTFSVNAQIQILDIGPEWKSKVEKAIRVIEKYDPVKYQILIQECKQIDFGLVTFATSDGNSVIVLPVEVMNRGCINDIAACLVHESLHIRINKSGKKIDPDTEEVICYQWELDFLNHLPKPEPWLIENARYQIIVYSSK